MNSFWFIIGAAVLAFLLTYIVRQISIKISIMDEPNERSSHTIPTPRGGGLAIAAVWFLAVLLLYLNGVIETELFYALLSGLILVVISYIDDILNISYAVRLIFQIISIAIGIYFLGGLESLDVGFFQIEQPVILSVLAGIALLWFINLYNFIDGIDGYAAVETIFISVAIFIIAGNFYVLFLGAAVLGYLYWNFARKKIFMGDVGSTLLGYTLGIIAIHESNQGELPVLVFAILSSLFWFDATITLFRRAKNKEKLTEAHKKHAYQRFVQGGYSHKQTVLYSIIINLVLFGIAYLATIYTSFIIPFLLLNLIFLYLLVRKVDTIKPFE
jgi:Fuc2NAc and GlcNAc transferase